MTANSRAPAKTPGCSRRPASRARYPARSELYDKWEDSLEQRDLAEEQPEVAARLNELASGYLQSPPPPWGEDAPTVEIDEMQLNQLRALGYGVR